MTRESLTIAAAIALVVTWLFLPDPAKAADILYAVLQDHDGVQSLHRAAVPSERCLAVLADMKAAAAEGENIAISFEDPPASGDVLYAYCVRPDGTIIGARE